MYKHKIKVQNQDSLNKIAQTWYQLQKFSAFSDFTLCQFRSFIFCIVYAGVRKMRKCKMQIVKCGMMSVETTRLVSSKDHVTMLITQTTMPVELHFFSKLWNAENEK